ncbi:MAG: hypothetical protein DRH08_01125 [Deltaproteobacteria bacterium]|nr:MAG: hypothetical protein DRH08_01125 [Deltaproteobacteria bacterium]
MGKEKISKMRLWAYRLITFLLIPCLFILCIEGGLRLFGVGHPVTYTTTCAVDGQDYFCGNTRFVEQFFPEQIARQPVSFAYPQKKPAGTFRIFILGASAAQGDPEHSYGFARILKVLLRERFPSLNFEIINTAITATNSHVVLPIAKEVSQHQPDLTIIYLGNNEVVGPFGAGTIFSRLSPNLTLIRAGIQVKTTRIGQTMQIIINKIGGEKSPEKWQGMEMFLGNQVPSDSAALETVYSHYQENLSDIIQTFRDKEIPVIVSTVGSNLKDFPPFTSQHRPSLQAEELNQWNNLYNDGMEQLQAGERDAALISFLQADQIDKSYADLQFFIGQSYLKLGDYSAARKHFELARDLDTLRFRADSRINDAIRFVVKETADSGVYLVDAVNRFDEQSPRGIQGEELYYEHVHLRFHGNYLLARDVAEKVLLSLPESHAASAGGTGFLNEQDCSDLLALSQFDRLRVKKDLLQRLERPPFSNQSGHDKRLSRLAANNTELETALTPEAIANDDSLYRQAIQSAEKDAWLHHNYGIFLKEQERPGAAIIQFEKFVNLLPRSYKGHHELAVMLAGSGRFKEALSHYQTAIDLIRVTETRTELRLLYAYAFARSGRYEESMTIYEKALAEDPSSAVNLYHAMAKLRIKTGPLTEALELLEKAIAANNEAGGIPDIYFNYGHVLKQLKKSEQSIAAYKEAIKTYEKELETAEESDKETLLVVSGRGYFETGEIDKGSRYLQQAIHRDPGKLDYHLTLITALARNGRQMEALKFTDQALVTMNEFSRPDAIAKLQGIRIQIAKR